MTCANLISLMIGGWLTVSEPSGHPAQEVDPRHAGTRVCCGSDGDDSPVRARTAAPAVASAAPRRWTQAAGTGDGADAGEDAYRSVAGLLIARTKLWLVKRPSFDAASFWAE